MRAGASPARPLTAGGRQEPPLASGTLAVRLSLLAHIHTSLHWPSLMINCTSASTVNWGAAESRFDFQGQGYHGTGCDRLVLRLERPGAGRAGRAYLDGVLELLMLPLQLLRLLQRAGRDEAGIQHRLPVADPAQHLQRYTGNSKHESRPAVT